MSKGLRKLPPAAQAKVDALADEYARLAQRRDAVERQVRAEVGRRLQDHEAVMATNVFRALAEPGMTYRAIVVAIRWSHLRVMVEKDMREESN